jgi:Uma2 family endonuclease
VRAPVTDFNQLDLSRQYTYADYLTWKFQERVELIFGKIFRMSPAPTSNHQYAVSVLHGTIFPYLKGKPCKVFPAPFDVILPIEGVLNSVIQPDITIVCDPSKITMRGCEGTPDLIVEVISKSSVTRDLHEKYKLYEQAGVQEYWIVHPLDRTLIIFTLDADRKYQPSKPLTKGDRATSTIFPGLEIDLDELFADLVEEPKEGYYAAEVKRL